MNWDRTGQEPRRHPCVNQFGGARWCSKEEKLQNVDVWGTVKKMREIYGARAAGIAKQRADRAREHNDSLGYDRWKHIAASMSPKTEPATKDAP